MLIHKGFSMNLIKKYKLWLLIIGSLSLLVEQAQAEIDPTIVVGVSVVSIAALYYGGYAMYHNYCKKVKQDEKILSYDEKVELLERLLRDQGSSDVNIQLLALRCIDVNKGEIEWLIDTVFKVAKNDASDVVMTKHFEIIFNVNRIANLRENLEIDLITCPENMRAVARHEAGHAIATLFSGANEFLYLHKIEIQSDQTRDKRFVGDNSFIPLYEFESDLTEDELKSFIMVDLGGFVAEFVFKDFAFEDHDLDGNDADCSGVHCDQIIRKRSQGAYGSRENLTESRILLGEVFQNTKKLIELHKDNNLL